MRVHRSVKPLFHFEGAKNLETTVRMTRTLAQAQYNDGMTRQYGGMTSTLAHAQY